MMIAAIALLIALTLPPVGDARNLDFDPTVRAAYAAKWRGWSTVYDRYAAWRGDRTLLPAPPIRAAAEYRISAPPDFRALRAAGYNAVVLLVDEDDAERIDVIHAAHGAGLTVLLAYCPARESLETTVYPDPQRLGSTLRRLGATADALLIGWRRTSVHLLRQDRAYTAYLIASARADHPALPVIGEVYSGETNASTANPAWRPAIQIPREAGAVIVVNYDRPGVDPAAAVALLTGRVTGLRKLFVARSRASGDALRNAGISDIITLINQ